MRVAAGVLLIITAVINLIASLGYLGGGAVATGMGSVSESAYEASLLEAESSMTAAEAEEYAEAIRGLKPGVTMMIMHCTHPSETFPHISDSGPTRLGDLRIAESL